MSDSEEILFQNEFGKVTNKRIVLRYSNGSEDIALGQVSSISLQHERNETINKRPLPGQASAYQHIDISANSENTFDHPQVVRVPAAFGREDAVMIVVIDAHAAGSVDDAVVADDDADVRDAAFFIVEKREVAGQRFFHEAAGRSEFRLLVCVAFHADAVCFENALHEAGAVDAER